MNIFVLDTDPKLAAQYHCDKHVVKMIVESVQMLHAPYYVTQTIFGQDYPREKPYRLTHKNHPCTKWVCESLDNWDWLLNLAFELLNEYTYRYKKEHACTRILQWMRLNPPNMERVGRTEFVLAMPDKYKTDNPVQSYRDYYIDEKQHIAVWTNRFIPRWHTGVGSKWRCLDDETNEVLFECHSSGNSFDRDYYIQWTNFLKSIQRFPRDRWDNQSRTDSSE